jgi:hypothetical protein
MLAVITTLSVPLLLVALRVTPPLYALAHNYKRRARAWHRQVKRVESEALGVVAEVMSALRVVKAFSFLHARMLDSWGLSRLGKVL